MLRRDKVRYTYCKLHLIQKGIRFMKTQSTTLRKVYSAAIVVIIPLIAAAWFIPPGFPMLLRQVLLWVWGVGATFGAKRLLFRETWGEAARH